MSSPRLPETSCYLDYNPNVVFLFGNAGDFQSTTLNVFGFGRKGVAA